MLTIELHAHSSLSHDGRDEVELLLDQAAAIGLDGLAVTDHDEIEASLRAVELAPDYNLIGIPGMEITTDAGHVLAIGVTELIPAGLSFEKTIDRIHDAGGIAIIPHPFQKSRSGVAANIDKEKLTKADAIEVYNSRLLTGRANRRAQKFARLHGMPMTAGSDAHISEMVGQAPTQIDTNSESIADILDAIREGKTSFEGKRTPWRISFRQAAGGMKRRFRKRMAQFFK